MDEKRWSPLWRYHERVLDACAVILAISRSQISDREFIYHILRDRQIVQLTDLIHDFSYNARKVIELTEATIPQIVEISKTVKVHSDITTLEIDDIDREQVTLTNEPLLWTLNRIIHARELLIEEATETIIVHELTGRLRSNCRPIAISFRSDRDSAETKHYVHIESLVKAYIGHIAPYIAEVAKSLAK